MALAGVLRNSIRPLSVRCFLRLSPFPVARASGARPTFFSDVHRGLSLERFFSTSTAGAVFSSLTDNRSPKRRPGTKPRRKRSSLRPPGPYAWVQYVPGEPIPRSRPNEGSVQGRKRKKRIKQMKAFILSEKKKRKAQWAEARKKRDMKRIERKMAAVAREKAWAQRLLELQQLEEAKKAAMAG
ncbi:uncharacterized protein LOC103706671 [Phoenix dactylifera]|uniref:Uncharacterized protein LOC103706671 n=1 Tax=Phoenix dactylifera TaxID=42345 RepID=A0A8B7C0B7_PHODC|nr:uncharacterized protein LOC103706671 [Phoenix dactylifera]XP_008789083.2 uncharacterized protein LOC103706671 [Phoenix dactylifera]